MRVLLCSVAAAWLLVAGSVVEDWSLSSSSASINSKHTDQRDLLLNLRPVYERHVDDAYARFVVCVDADGPDCDAASNIEFVGSDVVNPSPRQFRYHDTGPEALRGVFHFQGQNNGFSTLLSFAKTRHGEGVATGELGDTNGFAYLISPRGDHNWAFGGDEIDLVSAIGFDRFVDVLYQFQLDGGTLEAPTNFNIVSEGKLLTNCIRISVLADVWNFFVQVTMDLISNPNAPERLEYPGSVVWSRETRNLLFQIFPFTAFFFDTPQLNYLAVQIIDGNGNKIEPAYEEFRNRALSKFGNMVQFYGLQQGRVGDYLDCPW